jgi:hypothetical protein
MTESPVYPLLALRLKAVAGNATVKFLLATMEPAVAVMLYEPGAMKDGAVKGAVKFPAASVVVALVNTPSVEVIETTVPVLPKPDPLMIMLLPGRPLEGFRLIEVVGVVGGGGSSPVVSDNVNIRVAVYN